jgi:hypothetical protein
MKQNFGRYEGPGYIDSNGMRFYKSDPHVGQPGEPVEIPLRRKHSPGWLTAPRQNKHSDNNGRAKIKGKATGDNPPRKVMVVNAGRGTSVMMTQEAFAALSWGWEIE